MFHVTRQSVGISKLFVKAKSEVDFQDIVIKIAGLSVANPQKVLEKIGNTEPGKEIEFELYRDGKIEKIMVTVAELETKL